MNIYVYIYLYKYSNTNIKYISYYICRERKRQRLTECPGILVNFLTSLLGLPIFNSASVLIRRRISELTISIYNSQEPTNQEAHE